MKRVVAGHFRRRRGRKVSIISGIETSGDISHLRRLHGSGLGELKH